MTWAVAIAFGLGFGALADDVVAGLTACAFALLLARLAGKL